MVITVTLLPPEILQFFPRACVAVSAHISILEQEFEHRAITVILFGVLASEFNVESKNINRFAGERT